MYNIDLCVFSYRRYPVILKYDQIYIRATWPFESDITLRDFETLTSSVVILPCINAISFFTILVIYLCVFLIAVTYCYRVIGTVKI